MPNELSNRTTHRVPDGDNAPQPERVGEGGDVVCAIREAKAAVALNALAVVSLVDGNDAKMPPERLHRGTPVQSSRGTQTMEQDQRWSALRPAHFPHPGRPTPRQGDGCSSICS